MISNIAFISQGFDTERSQRIYTGVHPRVSTVCSCHYIFYKIAYYCVLSVRFIIFTILEYFRLLTAYLNTSISFEKLSLSLYIFIRALCITSKLNFITLFLTTVFYDTFFSCVSVCVSV